MSKQAVGFVGLGQMGAGMAENILSSTGQLAVHDLAPEASARLVANGARDCTTTSELAGACDIIVLCLPSSTTVETVLFGQSGVAQAAKAGTIVLDASTLDCKDTQDIAAQARAEGIHYCDCPVSGLPKRARDGTLTVMFGGDRATFDNVSYLLECFASSAIYCGDIGAGQAMKSINNIIYNINIAALCEVLPLAVAAGLAPDALKQVTDSGSSSSFASSHFVPKMLRREFKGDFAMQDAYKDIINVQRMGEDTNAFMPITNSMISVYEQALAAGYEQESKSAMLKLYEQHLDTEFTKY